MRVAAISMACVALAACESADRPIDPVWGKEACGSCAMLVSDPMHAAQLGTQEGKRVFFDDVGCMAAYVQERNITPAHMWVRDASGHWIDARTAKYQSGARTPMDYGLVVSSNGTLDFSAVERAARERREKRP
jgi:hypothetical protein